ncbi:MAG: EAL domain-containing protein [Gallionella sp.]|nr:EAL domain-containing protein [Gallionella sp.]
MNDNSDGNLTRFKTENQFPLSGNGAQSPARLLAIVAISIFTAEIAIMFAFEWLPPLPGPVIHILDGVVLTILVSPVLYLFLFRPMNAHIAALRQTQDLLRQQRDHLEEEVQHRTAELVERSREIADREVHYRAVVEGATEGILTLDKQGLIARNNTAAEKMFGFDPGMMAGIPLVQILTPDSAKRCLGSDGLLYPVSSLSLEAQNRKGETIPILLSVSTFKYENDHYFTAIIQDISERVMFEKRLARLAYYDSLTGLPNRRLFHDRLGQAIERARRDGKLVGILFLDLDHFKDINDTLGHLFGDLLLQETAKRLSDLLRKEDTVARLGGDEFTVILEGISNAADAEDVAKKILHSIGQPFKLGEHERYVTSSIGITLYPLDDSDIERLIMNADGAMYQAKLHGRNAYELYTPKIHSETMERVALEASFRKAVKAADFLLQYQPEFVLHYQPEVDRYSGEVVCAEALIRWQHPEFGLLSPIQFIPLAETTGLIIPLGEWVLRTACKQAVAWRKAGFPPFHIAVNVSALQLKNREIVSQVARILEETGMEGRYLELELTESVVLDKSEELIDILRGFKELGITISIDDFGTGHSSLANLQLLPVDKVKIDISFIRNVTKNEHDATIVTGIIEMAHKLGLKVVAEGVETEEQQMFLLEHHCDIMQGYHFSRPMAAEDFEALLVNRVETTPSKLSS